MRAGRWALCLLLLMPSLVLGEDPRVDPDTGAIRLLFIGDSFMQPGFPTPYYVDDPRIDVTPIPSEIGILGTGAEGTRLALRYYRMYLPRTKAVLMRDYDEVVIADAQSHHLRQEVQLWTKEGVVSGGLGFMMVDGPASFGGKEGNWGLSPSWGPTPIGEILPVECSEDRQGRDLDEIFRLVPQDPEDPLFRGKPWDTVFFYAHNRVLERAGGSVIARMSDNPPDSPMIATWDVGEGRSVALVFDWGGNGVTDFYRWPYCPDFLAHMVYFPARMGIPDDMELDHAVRILLSSYRERRLYVISVVEFAEKFGASSTRLYEEMKEIDAEKAEVDLMYRRLELSESREAIRDVLAMISELGEEAIRSKDRALLWIYVVEWCAVTGTAMVAGSILYTLMMRRRLYREVAVTRSR